MGKFTMQIGMEQCVSIFVSHFHLMQFVIFF